MDCVEDVSFSLLGLVLIGTLGSGSLIVSLVVSVRIVAMVSVVP